MSLMTLASDYYKARDILNVGDILEKSVSSMVCHMVNCANQDSGMWQEKGQVADMRSHIVSIMPSGFGKSLSFEAMLHEQYGLLSLTPEIPTSMEGTFSKECWLGTIVRDPDTGEIKYTGGIFDHLKRGIVGADEYQRIGVLMAGDGIEHDEVYLLQALSKSSASKNLAHGRIVTTGICTTLWAGMRPSLQDKYSGVLFNLNSGLVRRCLFHLYFPSRIDARRFNEMDTDMRVVRGQFDRREMLATHEWFTNLRTRLDMKDDPLFFDFSEVNQWCKDLGIQHFDRKLYKRLAMGYALATQEDLSSTTSTVHMPLSLVGPVIQSEFIARRSLREHIYDVVAYHIVRAEDDLMTLGELQLFLKDVYQYTSYQVGQILAQARSKSATIEVTRGGKLRVSDNARLMFEGGV